MVAFGYVLFLCTLMAAAVYLQVASGFLRIRRAGPAPGGHSHAHVWTLTFLLSLFILADVAAWWMQTWSARATFVAGLELIVAIPLVCALYVFAASMVFPRDESTHLELNGWFWMNRRSVLACIALANLAWAVVFHSNPGVRTGTFAIVSAAVYAAALLVALLTRRHRVAFAALLFLIADRLAVAGLEWLGIAQGA